MKWRITYEDKHHDTTHVWVTADSKENAEIVARNEYWDIERILLIEKKG